MSTGRHRASILSRPFPQGRVGLKPFLAAAGISKNTFFLRYRHDPTWIALLDIDEDRDHRLHFPAEAGDTLRCLRGKTAHGDAKIVFDKFHVLRHVGDAVDQVRRAEHKVLVAIGDTRLRGTKYDGLKHPAHFSQQAWRAFAARRDRTLQSARAWAMKESLRKLWHYRYIGAARTFFHRWYGWAMRSRLAPMKKVARMIKAHLDNILTYLTHRITNAVTEGLNAKIQWIKFASRGCSNPDAFKMAILFHCGGLEAVS